MDDILYHGKTHEEHDERLNKVIHQLRDAGDTEKCQFSKGQVTFLGQVIDITGIRPDPKSHRHSEGTSTTKLSPLLGNGEPAE